jgi:peptide chain release factor 3
VGIAFDERRVSEVEREARMRRTFAIISHPDAGKTTLTEKFLLYSGAIDQAGAVKARKQDRAARSDWMEMERRRGISITSTVLQFTYRDTVFNLLDTPGHRDFSEDTYRVLSAADAAVMVLDAAKGIEEQTLKLFEVSRARGIPLLTFVNKYDRPGLDPIELLDDVERRIGVIPVPVTWPVGIPGDLRGVIDRRTGHFFRFDRTPGGNEMAPEEIVAPEVAALREGDSWRAAVDEVALLEGAGASLDEDSYLRGEMTPVFFGSALSNFGVRLLLEALIDMAPSPSPRPATTGAPRPLEADFSGFVFKVQANMDPRHRDRIAFLRVCSGRFERGMVATLARTGKAFTLAYAHRMFGQERHTADEAYPGDVVGLVNAGGLRIGDTLYASGPVSFPPIPSFAPEHFMVVTNRDPSRYKQFRKALVQLEEEGVVQVLRHPSRGDRAPVLAAVGPMQFEVAQYRLETEFKVPVRLSSTDHSVARVTDVEGERAVTSSPFADVLYRSDGVRMALFKSAFQLERFQRESPDVTLEPVIVGTAETAVT